ncbi:MAG: 50S ribosomal protein L22 [Candidatus Paraimprobicoccus trichonymphae]|uniref:Large ribosomal subunit protein uL22 n=1 Tax=Candidatus Paraimprobicoccus trichonymphae TaxID=3033793 RepID=A0AA48IHE6_9FIRM|nr:MAG: 50S ribosomal protein L22 [Candidatus Paraimprobicoccus trichonymphae]
MKGLTEASAYLKYIRISPRKVSIVLDLIRNKPVEQAMGILKYTHKSACEYLEKLLKSAVSNAGNNFNMDITKLYVSKCFVSPGPILKRIQPVSKGRAHRIKKRSSHVTMTLKEKI